MDEKVLNLLGSLFNGSLDDTTDAKQVADSLKISRNRASSYLNLLVDGNKVIKVNTRPSFL